MRRSMPSKTVESMGLTERARSSTVAVLRAAAEHLERLPRRRAEETLLRVADAVEIVRREVLGRRTVPDEG
jgi:hypothetical protein